MKGQVALTKLCPPATRENFIDSFRPAQKKKGGRKKTELILWVFSLPSSSTLPPRLIFNWENWHDASKVVWRWPANRAGAPLRVVRHPTSTRVAWLLLLLSSSMEGREGRQRFIGHHRGARPFPFFRRTQSTQVAAAAAASWERKKKRVQMMGDRRPVVKIKEQE